MKIHRDQLTQVLNFHTSTLMVSHYVNKAHFHPPSPTTIEYFMYTLQGFSTEQTNDCNTIQCNPALSAYSLR